MTITIIQTTTFAWYQCNTGCTNFGRCFFCVVWPPPHLKYTVTVDSEIVWLGRRWRNCWAQHIGAQQLTEWDATRSQCLVSFLCLVRVNVWSVSYVWLVFRVEKKQSAAAIPDGYPTESAPRYFDKRVVFGFVFGLIPDWFDPCLILTWSLIVLHFSHANRLSARSPLSFSPLIAHLAAARRLAAATTTTADGVPRAAAESPTVSALPRYFDKRAVFGLFGWAGHFLRV